MNFTDFRLKLRRFIRKYKRIILVVFLIWLIIFLINQILKNKVPKPEATTTYKMHTSVMDTTSKTPISMQNTIEDMIKEYVGYCNEGNYQKAFNMLSEDCKEYAFNNDVRKFMDHVLVKMPTPKEYAIQNYSNQKIGKTKFYIYEIKYFDNFLATGLTNSDYSFTSENIVFHNEDEGIKMNVGNYIYHTNIQSMQENEYLKVDVIDKLVNYSIETYNVRFTNRSNYTVVISDEQESNEIMLALPNETRAPTEIVPIILEPRQSIEISFTFPKFVDDGDESQSLVLSAIRVMENYSGIGENIDKATIQSEIDNAISKFSLQVMVKE